MKHLVIFAGISALALSESQAQDPGFRDTQQPRRPQNIAAPAQPQSSDDTAAAAARMSSMESLDDARPLGVGDLVSLRIVEDRDKVLSLYVQDSGDIQAPFIGLVKANGRTCKQVAYFMKRELEKQYFQQATVIVALERVRPSNTARGGPGYVQDDTRYITVYGQVSRQGRYELLPEDDLTVSQAVLRAGGFSQFAQTKKVKVIRKLPKGGNVTIFVNLDDIMRLGKLEYDIPIRPEDVIIVTEKVVNI
ncbi:hypothetical protein BH11VER1_BH11VER1_34350 [soil metagenome]